MKILHLVKTYFPHSQGGIEEVVRSFTEQYIKMGHDVTVVACSPGGTKAYIDTYEGAKCFYFPQDFSVMSSPISFNLLKNIKMLVKDVDIVIAHTPWPLVDLIAYLLPENVSLVIFYHSDSISPVFFGLLEKGYNFFHKKTLSKASSVIVTSPKYLSSSRYLKPFSNKVSVIPLGINIKNYQTFKLSDMDCYLSSVGLEHNNFILFLGALRKYKGIQILIEAANICNLPIVVAGSGDDLEFYKSLSKSENTCFLGRVSDQEKNMLMSACRFFVFPSINRAEAFGVVLLEASLNAKAMLTTELYTGTSYVNLNDETGIVIAPNDSDLLASEMTQLFFSDQLEQYGKNSLLRVNSEFNISKLAKTHVSLFESISINDRLLS